MQKAQLISIFPELVLALSALALLMVGVFAKVGTGRLVGAMKNAAFVLVLGLGAIILLQENMISVNLFNRMLVVDSFALFCKAIIIFAAIMVLSISVDYFDDNKELFSFEIPILLILAVLGLLVMVSASDMLTFYMGLEMQSLAAYVLAAAKKGDKRTSEAGIKYFILGALASGILLYGISLIYGYTGATNFADIATAINVNSIMPLGVTVGLVLVIVGICFKLSAAPFHMWAPDVYDGVPTPVTAFFAIVPKLAAVAVLIRLLATSFAKFLPEWQQVIIIISVLSMLVGAFAGIWQQNIKRLMAYSSIGHMGYILAGVAVLGVEGTSAVLSYFVIYILNTIGIFAIILIVNARDKDTERNIKKIEHFAGFYKTNPAIAIIFTAMLVSMIGLPIPPFAGFWAKFLVFSAAINGGLYALAVIGVISSVVAAYYYLRIIKIMYFDEPAQDVMVSVANDKNIKTTIALVTIISLIIFLKPSLLTGAASIAAASLF